MGTESIPDLPRRLLRCCCRRRNQIWKTADFPTSNWNTGGKYNRNTILLSHLKHKAAKIKPIKKKRITLRINSI